MSSCVTRNLPVTTRNISLAASPLRHSTSPLRNFLGAMNGLSQSIDKSPCADSRAFLVKVSV
jgi:hypothetical protein